VRELADALEGLWSQAAKRWTWDGSRIHSQVGLQERQFRHSFISVLVCRGDPDLAASKQQRRSCFDQQRPEANIHKVADFAIVGDLSKFSPSNREASPECSSIRLHRAGRRPSMRHTKVTHAIIEELCALLGAFNVIVDAERIGSFIP
jgi:hypothetical protein